MLKMLSRFTYWLLVLETPANSHSRDCWSNPAQFRN